jgi:proline iminopeptidase
VAQIVYLDQRGMGRSDPDNKSRWNLDQWAKDVHSFCEVLEIENPIVLGVSFGGMVAMKYASLFPDHPSKLILSSTTARSDLQLSRDMFTRLGGEEAGLAFLNFVEDSTNNFEDFQRLVLPLYNTTSGDPDASKRGIMTKAVLDHFSENIRPEMDLRSDLREIICPTLVLFGDSDPLTPPLQGDRIVRELVNAEVRHETINNAGHGPWRDRPTEVLAILRDFVAL